MYCPPRPLHLRNAVAQLNGMLCHVLIWVAYLLLTFS